MTVWSSGRTFSEYSGLEESGVLVEDTVSVVSMLLWCCTGTGPPAAPGFLRQNTNVILPTTVQCCVSHK